MMITDILLGAILLTMLVLVTIEYRRLSRGNGVVDSLTGLPTETFFVEYVRRCAARASRMPGYEFAVVYITLGRNPQLPAGLNARWRKEILGDAADRIRDSLRPTDALAHVGDDVFLVLLENVHSREDAAMVSGRIRKSLLGAITLTGEQVFASARFGIAFGSATLGDPHTLIAEAKTQLIAHPVVSA